MRSLGIFPTIFLLRYYSKCWNINPRFRNSSECFKKKWQTEWFAKPGSRTYGVISVLVQAFYGGELILDVDRRFFRPPPKVQSAVIRLTRKTNQVLGCSEKLFRRVVKQAFSQRRKMLRNTMKSFIKGDELLEKRFF